MESSWTRIGVTHSPEETKLAAAALARVVEPGSVVALDGDLGAGKTHFTQGLAAALGVVEPVTSPTFNLMCAYGSGRIPLYHFDLYRLDDAEQLEDVGFYEFMEGDGVACVEWASKFSDELPDDRLEVYLEVEEGGARLIRARAQGDAGELLEAWRAATSQSIQ